MWINWFLPANGETVSVLLYRICSKAPPIAQEQEHCRLIKYECSTQRLPSLIANTKYKIQTAACGECGVCSSLWLKRKPGKSVLSEICYRPVNNRSSWTNGCGIRVVVDFFFVMEKWKARKEAKNIVLSSSGRWKKTPAPECCFRRTPAKAENIFHKQCY